MYLPRSFPLCEPHQASWSGASGRRYDFAVARPSTAWIDEPAVYILVRRESSADQALYVGHTDSLQQEFAAGSGCAERWRIALTLGMTHVHLRFEACSPATRQAEARDLAMALRPEIAEPVAVRLPSAEPLDARPQRSRATALGGVRGDNSRTLVRYPARGKPAAAIAAARIDAHAPERAELPQDALLDPPGAFYASMLFRADPSREADSEPFVPPTFALAAIAPAALPEREPAGAAVGGADAQAASSPLPPPAPVAPALQECDAAHASHAADDAEEAGGVGGNRTVQPRAAVGISTATSGRRVVPSIARSAVCDTTRRFSIGVWPRAIGGAAQSMLRELLAIARRAVRARGPSARQSNCAHGEAASTPLQQIPPCQTTPSQSAVKAKPPERTLGQSTRPSAWTASRTLRPSPAPDALTAQDVAVGTPPTDDASRQNALLQNALPKNPSPDPALSTDLACASDTPANADATGVASATAPAAAPQPDQAVPAAAAAPGPAVVSGEEASGRLEPADVACDQERARQLLALEARAPVVLFAGEISHAAGADIALDALLTVCTTDPAVQFVFAGDGPLRAECEDRARHANVLHRCRFLGDVSKDLFPNILAASDFVVIPARIRCGEGLARMALRHRKPVLATHQAGISVLEHGRNGLVTYDNPGSFVWGIRELLGPLREDMARRLADAA